MGITAGGCLLEKDRDSRTVSRRHSNPRRRKEVRKQDKTEDKPTANRVLSNLKFTLCKDFNK